MPPLRTLCLTVASLLTGPLVAQTPADIAKLPWMTPAGRALPADQRADLVVKAMTLDEKLQLVNGTGWGVLRKGDRVPARSNLGAGFLDGIDRLGIPDLNEADSAVGIRMAALQSRYATLLPSAIGAASSWDPDGAFLYGSVIGRELRQQGYNMSIGGGTNLTREPRNGRNFEYAGEDPVLAGTMTGNLMRGVAAQHVMSDIKHYAMNDQETGRNVVNVLIDKRAMRESDLLAFQIAIDIAKPSGVMCSYNLVNNDYACENDYLLNQVLKKDFNFKGFVLSDWSATHSTVKAALAGLDQDMPGDDDFFGSKLKAAVEAGTVPMARLDDMNHRILRSMFLAGVVDNPPVRMVVDPFKGLEDAQHIAEESIVLLRNENNILPFRPTPRGVLVQLRGNGDVVLIGGHADVGVLSGGGSAQVDPPGGNAIHPEPGPSKWGEPVYFSSSPLRAIREHAAALGNIHAVTYNPGTDLAAAAAAAKAAAVAIVFVTQPTREGIDSPTLALPNNQDALVEAVAKANPHTIVVLETGGPVSMPWVNQVAGVIETWYPGIGGAQALANILFGDVNPSGRLSVTFPKTEADLPHPEIAGMAEERKIQALAPDARRERTRRIQQFDLTYTEGAKVGYKWFEAEHKQPLFPFGFGLSYTTFTESKLKVDRNTSTVTFTVTNTGQRTGTEVAQVYVALPPAANENYKRLVAFTRMTLAPGESRPMTLSLPSLYMSVFDPAKDIFTLLPGDYQVMVGNSSANLPLTTTLHFN